MWLGWPVRALGPHPRRACGRICPARFTGVQSVDFSSSVNRWPSRRHKRTACEPCRAILTRVSLSRTLASGRPSNVRNSALEPSGRSTDGGRPEVMSMRSMRGQTTSVHSRNVFCLATPARTHPQPLIHAEARPSRTPVLRLWVQGSLSQGAWGRHPLGNARRRDLTGTRHPEQHRVLSKP